MKKLFFLAFQLLFFTSYSQVYIGCYTNGDTLSNDVIRFASQFKLDDQLVETYKKTYNNILKLESGEITILSRGNDVLFNKKLTSWEITPEMKKQMLGEGKPIGKIIFEKIVVAGADGKMRHMASTTFYRSRVVSKKCDEIKPGKINYTGKILTGKNKEVPVQNQKVVLKDKGENEVQSTVTDKYGDFTFSNVSTNEIFYVVFDDNPSKIKDAVAFMAKPDGTVGGGFTKKGDTFVYELLPAELNVLETMKEEDTELKIKNFGTSKENSITVIENIYYATNSTDITKNSHEKLDKIIKAMQENKTLKLAIASHTDSKGDDASNMVLSENRAQKVMDYFVSKGIEKERLSKKGYGETQIKNRCKNDVDCSEIENELNRRTEFKFTK